MKNIELANKMLENLDWFKKQSDWQETMDQFRPLIQEIMESEKCNPLKAAIPLLKKFKDDNDQYGAALLMAICVDMSLDKN